ncbi:MAG: hypothetical protein WCO07_01385 [bacterium]
MATYNKFNAFVANIANKKHNLGADQLAVALTATANAPVATNVALADLTQVSYTNLSSRNITTTSSTQTSGTYKLILADLTLTASGAVASFQYVVIYNTIATSFELICWYDYGSAVTLANGDQFVIDFDNTNGLLQIA